MAPNLLSRLIPTTTGSPSVYEAIQQYDDLSETSDIEERGGMTVDDENLEAPFDEYELEHADAVGLGDSQTTHESAAFSSRLGRETSRQAPTQQPQGMPHAKWMSIANATQGAINEADEGDDEVPASLLIEGDDGGAEPIGRGDDHGIPLRSRPMPGPSTRETRARWEAVQAQQQLYQEGRQGPPIADIARPGRVNVLTVDPKKRAYMRWANVENLDIFLKEVYEYFLGNGLWCIVLGKVLNILTLAFVVSFSTFLTMCIDYTKLSGSTHLSQIMVPQCTRKMSGSVNLLLWLFTFYLMGQTLQYSLELWRLLRMRDFYTHLLEIPDDELQTISWQEVVARLMALRDANPITADNVAPRNRKYMGSQSKQRMDAHDIANRLMRRENYLIALFNKDILDLRLPIPFLRNRQFFSRTMEWNLSFTILDFVFNQHGQVRPLFLKDSSRKMLSEALRRRFLIAGLTNVIFAPFIIVYCIMHYFFRYFNEYQKNPSQLGSRQYTPLAEWKFREFNELWHLFQRRVNMSYPFASRYVDQFPKEKTIQLSRFIAFVTGALVSVLALASIFDPDLFLGFELTPDRTVLFYLGVFGTIWAVARGVVPDDNHVFDPEFALRDVVEYTHYMPNHWKGRLHTEEVKKEFSALYQMKIITFIEEIMSLVFTPFVLLFTLPLCCDRIVDFFREFTVHVDGLGYICSFALFDFKKGGNTLNQQRRKQVDSEQALREDYYATKDGKMLASYFGFLDNYATNPRGNAPKMYQPSKRQFYPPPNFQGLTSPEIVAQGGRSDRGRYDRYTRGDRPVNRQIAISTGQSQYRTSRFPTNTSNQSLVPSILLDPHHQPTTSSFRNPGRLGAQSRYRSSRPNLADEPIEDDEESDIKDGQIQDDFVPTDSVGMLGDESLGDSWKTTKAATKGEDDDDDLQAAADEKGAGVLGILYQFQKAHNEGRGGGTNL